MIAHDDHTRPETGQLVAAGVIGVNHDHYFSYRLDFDVDGATNSFMLNRMAPQRVDNDPMRKSIWVNQPVVAAREKDAILDIRLDQTMWHELTIRPFHFFKKNPVLDLPKSLAGQ